MQIDEAEHEAVKETLPVPDPFASALVHARVEVKNAKPCPQEQLDE
jgi:hypothetical protein